MSVEGVNLALEATATGSISNTPTTIYNTPDKIKDGDLTVPTGSYGFSEDENSGEFITTVTLDLGSVKEISKIRALLYAEVKDSVYAEFSYQLEISENGTDYELRSGFLQGINFYLPDDNSVKTANKEFLDASLLTIRYVRFTCKTTAYIFSSSENAVSFFIKELEILDRTESHEGENIAPQASVSGSITNTPTFVVGNVANTIDEDIETGYGLRERQNSRLFIETVILEFAEPKSINEIVLRHSADVFDFGGLDSNTAFVFWEIFVSDNGIAYTRVASGLKTLGNYYDEPLNFYSVEAYEQTLSTKYVKVVSSVETQIDQPMTVTAVDYAIVEIEVYAQSSIDIGLRIDGNCVCAKIATNSEPLRILVNDTVYGLVFDENSPLKIMANGIKGIKII